MKDKKDYVMIEVKKLCPLCIMMGGSDIPQKLLRLCRTHREKEQIVWSKKTT